MKAIVPVAEILEIQYMADDRDIIPAIGGYHDLSWTDNTELPPLVIVNEDTDNSVCQIYHPYYDNDNNEKAKMIWVDFWAVRGTDGRIVKRYLDLEQVRKYLL